MFEILSGNYEIQELNVTTSIGLRLKFILNSPAVNILDLADLIRVG
jgi:hypothetical protein